MSHKPRAEADGEEPKPKYYMRKDVFNGLPNKKQRESMSKGERNSQNSVANSSRHLNRNSFFGLKLLTGIQSQNNSSRLASKASPSITGLVNSSMLR